MGENSPPIIQAWVLSMDQIRCPNCGVYDVHTSTQRLDPKTRVIVNYGDAVFGALCFVGGWILFFGSLFYIFLELFVGPYHITSVGATLISVSIFLISIGVVLDKANSRHVKSIEERTIGQRTHVCNLCKYRWETVGP